MSLFSIQKVWSPETNLLQQKNLTPKVNVSCPTSKRACHCIMLLPKETFVNKQNKTNWQSKPHINSHTTMFSERRLAPFPAPQGVQIGLNQLLHYWASHQWLIQMWVWEMRLMRKSVGVPLGKVSSLLEETHRKEALPSSPGSCVAWQCGLWTKQSSRSGDEQSRRRRKT